MRGGLKPWLSTMVTNAVPPEPGQSLGAKAKEPGSSRLTLCIWTAEWRGSGYNPNYVIRQHWTELRKKGSAPKSRC